MIENDMGSVMSAIRIKEMKQEQPLYHDGHAEKFANEQSFVKLEEMTSEIPYFEAMLSVRHRLFIEMTQNIIQKAPEIGQLISLGAGYCTMVDYLTEETSIKGFEVDIEKTCTKKSEKIGEEYKPVLIPMKLTADFQIDDLLPFGFNPALKTICIMEGLLYYFESLNEIKRFMIEISTFILKSKSYLLFDMQVGVNPLTAKQREITKDSGMNDCFMPLSFWTELFESHGLEIVYYSKVAVADRWSRLNPFISLTKSAIFLVQPQS